MAGVDIELKGAKELDKALSQLPINVEKRVINRSLMRTMRFFRKELRAIIPTNDGDISPSSKEFKSAKKNVKVSRGKKKKGKKVFEAVLHTGNAFWLRFYELGSVHQPARPFFLPWFRSSQTRIIEMFKSEVGKGIEDEAKKLKK